MLAQAHRLRRSADFEAVIRRGRRCGDRLLVVYAAPAGPTASAALDGPVMGTTAPDGRSQAAPIARNGRSGVGGCDRLVWQAGLVVSKAVGNSVVRHRVSRRLRAILAERMPHLGTPRRVVVRALAPAASAAFQDLDRAVGRCLGEAAR